MSYFFNQQPSMLSNGETGIISEQPYYDNLSNAIARLFLAGISLVHFERVIRHAILPSRGNFPQKSITEWVEHYCGDGFDITERQLKLIFDYLHDKERLPGSSEHPDFIYKNEDKYGFQVAMRSRKELFHHEYLVFKALEAAAAQPS